MPWISLRHSGWGTTRQNLSGAPGDDKITGTNSNDTNAGDAGNDRIHGGSGDDIVLGNKGNDTLWGDNGADTPRGGKGDDWIFGGNGLDELHGDFGADVLIGGLSADTYDIVADWAADDTILLDGFAGGSANVTYDGLNAYIAVGQIDVAVTFLGDLSGFDASDIDYA